MNKKQYFDSLEKNLKSLKREESDDILQDFREYFEIGIERGRTQEELMASLGSPKTLARQIRFESYVKLAEGNASAAHIGKAVFTSIGLSFFNLIFILPLFLIVLGLLSGCLYPQLLFPRDKHLRCGQHKMRQPDYRRSFN